MHYSMRIIHNHSPVAVVARETCRNGAGRVDGKCLGGFLEEKCGKLMMDFRMTANFPPKNWVVLLQVGGFKHVLLSIIYRIILPID